MFDRCSQHDNIHGFEYEKMCLHLDSKPDNGLFTIVKNRNCEKFKIFKGSYLEELLAEIPENECKEEYVYITDDNILFYAFKLKDRIDSGESLTNNAGVDENIIMVVKGGSHGCIPEFEMSKIRNNVDGTHGTQYEPLKIKYNDKEYYPAFTSLHPPHKNILDNFFSNREKHKCGFFEVNSDTECLFLSLFEYPNIQRISAGFSSDYDDNTFLIINSFKVSSEFNF